MPIQLRVPGSVTPAAPQYSSLLVARRQRQRPDVMGHVEVVGVGAFLVLRVVDLVQRRRRCPSVFSASM